MIDDSQAHGAPSESNEFNDEQGGNAEHGQGESIGRVVCRRGFLDSGRKLIDYKLAGLLVRTVQVTTLSCTNNNHDAIQWC